MSSEREEQRRKQVAANLLGGLSPRQIAEAMKQPLSVIMADVRDIMAQWIEDQGHEEPATVDLRRLDLAINELWGKVTAGDDAALDRLVTIIKLRRDLRREMPEQAPGGWRPSHRQSKYPQGGGEGGEGENSQFTLSERVPGQRASRAAQRVLEREASAAWMEDYWTLRREGWEWRKAAYIAWASSPVKGRWPRTQEALAVEVLGLQSDRAICHWRADDPAIDERVGVMQAEPLMRRRRDVLEALMQSASDPAPAGHQDRKLFLTLTGDFKPTKAVEVSGEDGGPIKTQAVPIDLSELNNAELDQLARLAQRFAGD